MKKIILPVLMAALLMSVSVSASNFAEEEDVGAVRFDVQKATTAWKGDGVWTEGEYYEIDVQDSWMSAACGKAEDLDATQWLDFTLAMSWDENYIYGYLNFYDENGHEQLSSDNPGDMWVTSCLHIAGAEKDAVDQQSLKYGIALTSDTNKLMAVTWIDYPDSNYDANANGDYFITNNDNEITYEWRTPISAFSAVTPAEGAEYAYGLSLGWGNDGSRQHTQIGAGLSGGPGEQASRFPRITLAAAPAVEAETVADAVAETETVTTAPQTLDAGIVAAVAAAVSAAGYAVSKKH